jgi:decaprenylphospho-beta-D-ribofuranose 2-oxidase
MDVVSGTDFLNDLYVVSYWIKDRELAESPRLHPVRNHIASSMFQWSEKGDWAKRMRWQIETALLGNNALHSELTRADLLLRQAGATAGQSRQVYYIPVAQFVPFMDDLRTLATTQQWSFNQISVHYLEKSSDLLLAPQQGNTLAIVVNMAKTSSAEQQAVTPVLMDLALKHDGSFALDQWTTQDLAKVKLAYPEFDEFQQLKEAYDTNGLFVSALYPGVKAG